MDFLTRFKELTEEKSLTLTEVADGAKLPRSTVSSYVNRGSMPSILQARALADFFGCSVDYLIGREDDFGVISSSNSEELSLSDSELELLELFRTLSEVRQETILDSLRGMAVMQKKKA
ncbi:MAG: helix-turn-helix transcriptional regulator [Clostridia bacterium]|nr:helix-turn-helix transcriptional regulator [Clostridia bacterium]